MKSVFRFLLMAPLVASFLAPIARAEGEWTQESQAHFARALYYVTKFVTWPESNSPKEAIVLCFFAPQGSARAFKKALVGRSSQGLPLRVKEFPQGGEGLGCSVTVNEAIPRPRRDGVLSVGTHPRFLADITLSPTTGHSGKIAIQREALERRGFRVSAELLAISTVEPERLKR